MTVNTGCPPPGPWFILGLWSKRLCSEGRVAHPSISCSFSFLKLGLTAWTAQASGRGQLHYLPLITSGEPLLEIHSGCQQCVESLHGPPLEFSEAGRRLAEEKTET